MTLRDNLMSLYFCCCLFLQFHVVIWLVFKQKLQNHFVLYMVCGLILYILAFILCNPLKYLLRLYTHHYCKTQTVYMGILWVYFCNKGNFNVSINYCTITDWMLHEEWINKSTQSLKWTFATKPLKLYDFECAVL